MMKGKKILSRMSKQRSDFEQFIAETLLHEFLDAELKNLKAQQKSEKDAEQKKRDAGTEGEEGKASAGQTPKMFKSPGKPDADEAEEKEDNNTGTIGNTPAKVEILRSADHNWQQMVAYSKYVTRQIKNAMSKMQTDDVIRMRKAVVTFQRTMKVNLGRQYSRLLPDVGDDSLTAKVALMQIISQLIQDLEAGK